MEAPSPARLYAAAIGALLVVLGLLGFFYTASFEGLDEYEEALGALQVNGWLNLFYVAIGVLGLLTAAVAPRRYALATGLLFTLLAIVGWGSGTLHLVIGLLGLAAAAGTPKPESPAKKRRRSAKRGSKVASKATKEPRKSKSRAKPARDRA